MQTWLPRIRYRGLSEVPGAEIVGNVVLQCVFRVDCLYVLRVQHRRRVRERISLAIVFAGHALVFVYFFSYAWRVVGT